MDVLLCLSFMLLVLGKVGQDGADEEQHRGGQGNQEEHEVVVVLNSNTVVYPGTVMIKPLHAFIADTAVSRPKRSDYFTVST